MELRQATLLSLAQRGAREQLADIAASARVSGSPVAEAPGFEAALAEAEAVLSFSIAEGVAIAPAFARAVGRARRAAEATE